MLRITRTEDGSTVNLKLEGKIIGPWVSEFRAACAQEAGIGRPLALDLSEVTFVDAQGVTLLRQLANEGHRLCQCSSFVAELLHPGRFS